MVARICVSLLLSGALSACRSAPADAQVGREFGPVKILLYAEIREATYGWLGDRPIPANYEVVTYSYSANFKELDSAIAAVLLANQEGTPTADGRHKAVSAIVTAQRIKPGGDARGSDPLVGGHRDCRSAGQPVRSLESDFGPARIER